VVHERVTADLHVDEAEVLLQVETRGPAHSEAVTRVLRESGYTPVFG
jgi:threonine dehydratase